MASRSARRESPPPSTPGTPGSPLPRRCDKRRRRIEHGRSEETAGMGRFPSDRGEGTVDSIPGGSIELYERTIRYPADRRFRFEAALDLRQIGPAGETSDDVAQVGIGEFHDSALALDSVRDPGSDRVKGRSARVGTDGELTAPRADSFVAACARKQLRYRDAGVGAGRHLAADAEEGQSRRGGDDFASPRARPHAPQDPGWCPERCPGEQVQPGHSRSTSSRSSPNHGEIRLATRQAEDRVPAGDGRECLARLRLRPTRHVSRPPSSHETVAVISLAASNLSATKPLRKLGSTVKIDAAQDV